MQLRPHILFILTDQQRADCLGCAGHKVVKTPNIDSLAAEGVRFTNCFTTSPLCVPARIALTRGLYPHNSNAWLDDATVTVPLDADTYVRRLRNNGYHTAGFGKGHLFPMEGCDLYANEKKYHAIGFEHIEDMSGTWGIIDGRDLGHGDDVAKSVYIDHLRSLGLLERLQGYLKELDAKPDEERRFIAEPLPIPPEDYMDAFLARRVEEYIKQREGNAPTFIYVGFQGPHEPWDAPSIYTDIYNLNDIPDPIAEKPQGNWLSEKSRRYHTYAQYFPPASSRALKKITAGYFGKITQIDASVGSILNAYKRKGWLDNTVVIFASDHGEMLGDHGHLSKSMFYESALRVPLIIRMPDGVHSETTVSALVETMDIHATILDIAGCKPWKDQDSISLLAMLRQQASKIREDILSEVHVHYMLRTDQWKIVVGKDGETLQLFDLTNDPLEQINLCGHSDYRHRELHLRSRLLARIIQNTWRPGEQDAEFSGHSLPKGK